MSSGRHQRNHSSASGNQSSMYRTEVVHETRELEHYCLMKLITSVSQMKPEIQGLYASADSLQSQLDHLQATHNAHMLELRAQITELRTVIEAEEQPPRVEQTCNSKPLNPSVILRISEVGTLDELSFSDIDAESLVDDDPCETIRKPAPLVQDLEYNDTSSQYSVISIPPDWRKSKVAPSSSASREAQSTSPAMPSRSSLILPEFANLHPLRGKKARDSILNFRNSQADMAEKAGRWSRLKRESQPIPDYFAEEEENQAQENSIGIALSTDVPDFSATPAWDCTSIKPSKPKSISHQEELLKPLSCGEPIDFLSSQQLLYLRLNQDGV